MSEANGTRCCAKCSSPYGHSAVAGICCHPVALVELARANDDDADGVS